MAALGVPPLLWVAARRTGAPAVNALAWPALGLLFVCLMLSYSRGALLALGIGLVFWFAVVPLRLRAAAPLIAAAVASAPVVAWAFARDALSTERIPLAARADAGHDLGALLLLLCVVLLVVGLAVELLRDPEPAGSAGAEDRRLVAGRRAGGRAGGDRGRGGRLARRAEGPDLGRLEQAHRPGREHADEHAGPPDRDLIGARALLERGAPHLRSSKWIGRRRRRLRGGAHALPHRPPDRAPRPRLHDPDARRPRADRGRAVAARGSGLAGRRGAVDRPAAARPRAARSTPSGSGC